MLASLAVASGCTLELHRELLAFVRAGVPPVDALRFATINGARAFGLEDELGSIATGKLADLFVVKGNPLEDIRHARNVELVIRGGIPYHATELLKSVEGTIGPGNESEEMDWKPDR